MIDQPRLLKRAEEYDPNIISLLLQSSELKEKFFVKAGGAFVFKTNDFRLFLEEHKPDDNTYTCYENKIGLACNARLFRYSEDVVLNFPYKDCVLQGGQSAEEGKDTCYVYREGSYQQRKEKRKEIFFNSILAPEEKDRLFDPKAFVNWRKYTGGRKTSIAEIKRCKDGTIRENLIVNGNNLLALHCLKSQFAGKVKMIYIDPPYNTGGDANAFTYNNNFNHSTWLVFMKNRLEVAKNLLREDGFIAIAIDHCELFYLGVLADEIFGRSNRLGCITVVQKPEGRAQKKFFGESNEFMLVYAKNPNVAKFEVSERSGPTDRSFIGNYTRKERPHLFYPIYVSNDMKTITTKETHGYNKILPISGKTERAWFLKQDSLEKKIRKGEIIACRDKQGNVKIFTRRARKPVFVTHWVGKMYNANANGTKLLEKLMGRKTLSYPKSLYTVLKALTLTTSGNDIILDFFAGSGTTAHATLALNKEDGGNRQFILVEQLDKHIDICVERNQRVLVQEGIDNSFVYCELAKWNEAAADKIRACSSYGELKKLFAELEQAYFLNYNFKIKEFKEKIMEAESFVRLSLDDQKCMFIAMLDNNQMYVNKSEMADKKFKISAGDQSLTRKFYNEQGA